MNNRSRKGSEKSFWNREYKKGGKRDSYLAISNNPSEDLMKFINWLSRQIGQNPLNARSSVVDLGCGNGRNLIYLAKNYGVSGIGYDISSEAIAQARELSAGLNLKYEVRSIAGQLPLENESQDLALDMMTSHFLNQKEREDFIVELTRVIKPGGWLYLKTFLLDEDAHAKRLIKEHPAEEHGSYIHPKIGVAEHVFTEDEIKKLLGENFKIHKMLRSHRHRERGHAAKRRSISIYAERV